MTHARGVEEATLRSMCAAITHRGPDDEGVFVKGNVGLGIRRLSIIDVAGGHQPISNEDGTATVVYNGEIYNFGELRTELAERGHVFSTRSDTEVIVHGYEEFGHDVVHRLHSGPVGARQGHRLVIVQHRHDRHRRDAWPRVVLR